MARALRTDHALFVKMVLETFARLPSHEDASQKANSRSRLNGLLAAQSEEERLEGIVEVAQEADVPEEEVDMTEKEAVGEEQEAELPFEAMRAEDKSHTQAV